MLPPLKQRIRTKSYNHQDLKDKLRKVRTESDHEPPRDILILDEKKKSSKFIKKKVVAFQQPDKIELVNQGTYTTVYKVDPPNLSLRLKSKIFPKSLHQRSKSLIMRKEIENCSSYVKSEEQMATPIQQIFNIILLHHQYKHIIQIFYLQNEKLLNLITDYLPMNLKQMINLYKSKHKQIPRIIIKLFAYQLFRGLAFLHQQNICHRNLAPDNILVNPQNLQLKICDFGSAKFMQRGELSMPQIGDKSYRSPEQLLGSKTYGLGVDLWAVGCILVEINTLKVLFEGQTTEEVFSEVIKQLGTPNLEDLHSMEGQIIEIKLPQINPILWESTVFLEGQDDGFVGIIKKLIQFKPYRRGSAFDYLTDPYFKELKRPNIKINNCDIPNIFNFTHGNKFLQLIFKEELKMDIYRRNYEKLVPDWYYVKKLSQEDVDSLMNL